MSAVIRPANRSDAPLWLDLLKAALGEDYPARQVYDLTWIATELASAPERETWVAEQDGRLLASVSFLQPLVATFNPVANLGRCMFRPESFLDGAAHQLVEKVTATALERRRMVIVRVPVSSKSEQLLYEKLDYTCVGFQPAKHLHPTRHGILFYTHAAQPILATRMPISHSLPHVSELASRVLQSLRVPPPGRVEDGATGYPLQSMIEIAETSNEQFEAHYQDSLVRQTPSDISTGYHRGFGLLRVNVGTPRALLAQSGPETLAGVSYINDEHDRCVRIVDAFSTDDLSLGPLLYRAVTIAHERFNAGYIEMDAVMAAPRWLKTAEQLGFVPVAYFPGFNKQDSQHVDVVKLVKLNTVYEPEPVELTEKASAIVKTIEGYFEDQKSGVAVINLLRALPMFDGLGDGELRKVARLFQQKFIRAGESIFVQGGAGDEAYIVLRGQVDIMLEDPSRPIATIGAGQIFGEQAFLDGAPRTATAAVNQPTILLVIQRSAFHELAQREPHLGMMVMRNIAFDLSAKLRKTNSTWIGTEA